MKVYNSFQELAAANGTSTKLMWNNKDVNNTIVPQDTNDFSNIILWEGSWSGLNNLLDTAASLPKGSPKWVETLRKISEAKENLNKMETAGQATYDYFLTRASASNLEEMNRRKAHIDQLRIEAAQKSRDILQ